MKFQMHSIAIMQPRAGVRHAISIAGVVGFLVALAFSGCVSRPALDDKTFDFTVPAVTATNRGAGNAVLEIASLKVAAPFDGRALVYRMGEYSYERDPYAQFLGLPAEDLAAPVCAILRGTGCFSDVVAAGSGLKPDILVEITVDQLYGDFRTPKKPYAVLAMQITFLDATNGMPGRVVLPRYYVRRIPMDSTSPASLMGGWNRGLNEILQEAASDFRRGQNE